MKKVAIALLAVLVLGAGSAYACPKGEHPHGGTGPHHKGGYCS
ncbi:hypothetical protein GCM10027040_27810 [Halomonas shantousis]